MTNKVRPSRATTSLTPNSWTTPIRPGGVDGGADVYGGGQETYLEGDEEFLGRGPVARVLFDG